MYYNDDFEPKFSKVFKGYDTFEVDSFIQRMQAEIVSLNTKTDRLKEEIRKYQEQDSTLKSVLMNAQRTALETKLAAERESAEIIRQSELRAKEMLDKALEELVEYKENIFKVFFGCEHRLKAAVESTYSRYRYHMEQLEKEMSEEIEKIILRYNRDFDRSFVPKEIAKKNETKKGHSIDDLWKVKEDFFLIGKKTEADLKDQDGMVVLDKGTTVTPKIIDSVIEKGLYGELILALKAN